MRPTREIVSRPLERCLAVDSKRWSTLKKKKRKEIKDCRRVKTAVLFGKLVSIRLHDFS